MTENYLNAEQVAKMFGFKKGKAGTRLIRRIPGAFKVSNEWRILEADVHSYTASLAAQNKSGG